MSDPIPVLTREGCANLISWMHEEPEPMRWILDQWIPEGCCGILKAHGGVGKSNLVITMAMAITANMVIGPFRPTRETPYTVLIINGEDGSKALHRRLFHARRLFGPNEKQLALYKKHLLIYPARDTIGTLMCMDPHGNPIPTEYMTWLQESVAALNPDLVILDTKSRFFGLPDENSNTLNSAFIRAVERAVVTSTRSCLILHHTGKVAPGKEMEADGGRGGSSTGDDARFIIAAANLTEREARRLKLDPERHFKAKPVKQSYGPLAAQEFFKREAEGIPVHINPTDSTVNLLAIELLNWLRDEVKTARISPREFKRGGVPLVKKFRYDIANKFYQGSMKGVAIDLENTLNHCISEKQIVIRSKEGSSSGFIALAKG